MNKRIALVVILGLAGVGAYFGLQESGKQQTSSETDPASDGASTRSQPASDRTPINKAKHARGDRGTDRTAPSIGANGKGATTTGDPTGEAVTKDAPDAIKHATRAQLAAGQKTLDEMARESVRKASSTTSSPKAVKCLMAFMKRGATNEFKGKLEIKLKVEQDAKQKDRLKQQVDQITAKPKAGKDAMALKDFDEEAYLCFYKALNDLEIEKPPMADDHFKNHDSLDVKMDYSIQIRARGEARDARTK